MDWSAVGDWLKRNATGGAALIGNLLVGNYPGAIAAGAALVSSATGTTDPKAALQALQADPATMVRLRELAVQEESHIRDHIRQMEESRLKDEQAAHREQQETIRSGDNSADPYVRHTRPMMARQSWYAGLGYTLAFEVLNAFKVFDSGAQWEITMTLMAPALGYAGFRTLDKFAPWRKK